MATVDDLAFTDASSDTSFATANETLSMENLSTQSIQQLLLPKSISQVYIELKAIKVSTKVNETGTKISESSGLTHGQLKKN